MTIHSPEDLIATFRYQFPTNTAGAVVFLRDTLSIFVEFCQAIDSALGKDMCGFHWIRIQADQSKFHVDPGTKSSDLAALCREAKSQLLKSFAMFAIRNTNGFSVTYSEHLHEDSFTCKPHSSKLRAPESLSKVRSPDEIVAALPYRFAGRHIGLNFHRGLQCFFSRLCFEIDTALGSDKRGFHWVPIKENWGALKANHEITRNVDGFNYSPISLSGQQSNVTLEHVARLNGSAAADFDRVGKHIVDLITATCKQSSNTCVVCSQSGDIRNYGLIACFCDHNAKRFRKHRDSLPPFWWSMDCGGYKW